MKKKIGAYLAVFLVLSLFALLFGELTKKDTKEDSSSQTESKEKEEEEEEDTYYSFSDVKDVVGYLADTPEQKKELDRLVDPLTKSEKITVSYVKNIVNIIAVPDTVYTTVLKDMSDDDKVTKEQFDMIYHNIADTGMVSDLSRHDIFVYDVYEQNDAEGSYDVIYDGTNTYKLGIDLPEEYKTKIIDAYFKDGKIFKVNGHSDAFVELDNIWLLSVTDTECKFMYSGKESVFPIDEEAGITTSSGGYIAKIKITNAGVSSISRQPNTLDARILDVSPNKLTVENHGMIELAEDFTVYDIYSGVVFGDSIYTLTGYANVTLVLEEGKAIAAVIREELAGENIRVILSNTSYTSYDMESVCCSCHSAFEVTYPDESVVEYSGGESVTIDYEDYSKGDVITINPISASGKIQLLSITREYGNPEYEGTIEIRILEDGLNVINELLLENYLYSVVSSEMPGDNHEEAMKAMAICARGYAYGKIKDKSFDAYHAHLDDSSLCQVYNNYPATEKSIKAVNDTYGLVPTYDDTLIVPLYFSTSVGTTCTNEEIWGGSAYPYLESNVENISKDSIDLSDEQAFISFIKDSSEYDIIDKDEPYYRWTIEYTNADMTQAVNSMLEERVDMSSDNIKVKNENGNYVSEDISDIGVVKKITITERSKSGVATTMEIIGELATIKVTGQTNIRNLITPVNQSIVRQDGSIVTGWTSLPSPFYYVEQTDDGFVIHGGGFGHGVGMSQNGAGVLAENGYNYKYILRHYYSYINFTSIYEVDDK